MITKLLYIYYSNSIIKHDRYPQDVAPGQKHVIVESLVIFGVIIVMFTLLPYTILEAYSVTPST